MRTTVRLDPQLLKDTKRFAADTGRTLTAVIEDALREVLARRTVAKRSRHVVLPTFKGTGLREGVDLSHSAGLLDLMDSAGDAAR